MGIHGKVCKKGKPGFSGADSPGRGPAVAAFAAASLLLCAAALGAEGRTVVSDRGTVVRDGREYIPFGVYHVSWIGERYGKQLVGDMETIADSGFNVMTAALDPTSRKSDEEFLEKAAGRNVGVMAEVYLPSLGILVDRMKGSPAILSWQIGDDFNVTKSKNFCAPELLKERHLLAKARDPDHLTYASGGSAIVEWYRPFGEYAGCVDLVGIQCYPIENLPDFPEPEALDECRALFQARAAEALEAKIVPIANLQAFSWEDEHPRFPTPSESRNMLYGALDAGVKGVLHYAFYDGKGAGGKETMAELSPRLWEEIGRQVGEVALLEPFLLAGNREELSTGCPRVHASRWTATDGGEMLLVLSTERAEAREVKIAVPESKGATLTPLFPGRPAGLTLTDGLVSGQVGPEEVHVYRLEVGETRP